MDCTVITFPIGVGAKAISLCYSKPYIFYNGSLIFIIIFCFVPAVAGYVPT